MKNLSFTLVTVFSAILFSCSSDDASSDASLVGSWELSAMNLNVALDLNQDGVSSTNLLDELPCYSIDLTFNGDGSFDSSIEVGISFLSDSQWPTCDDGISQVETAGGSWSYSNGQLTVIQEGETTTQNISINGNSFSMQLENGDFGDMDFGATSLVFSKVQ